mmetsp:Transcript_2088/g.6286  ORF Transcript_2088/g.6286 Transcript_2088/m.6286 type:complete len:90 (+) Transcript_2088:16-285(+)
MTPRRNQTMQFRNDSHRVSVQRLPLHCWKVQAVIVDLRFKNGSLLKNKCWSRPLTMPACSPTLACPLPAQRSPQQLEQPRFSSCGLNQL